jgi:hypothetical protein
MLSMDLYECSGCGLLARWINARDANNAASLFKLDVMGDPEGTAGTIIIKNEKGRIVLKLDWVPPQKGG